MVRLPATTVGTVGVAFGLEVMIRIATTVDDTVLLNKSMLAEWVQDIEEICFDKYGHKAKSIEKRKELLKAS